MALVAKIPRTRVAEAIARVGPYGVDVASGVEDGPGIKNLEKVARFLARARSAFEQQSPCHR